MKAFPKQIALLSCAFRLLVFLPSIPGQVQGDEQNYVPSEMQVADPEVKTYLDTADTQEKNGEYEQAFLQLQKALELCVKKDLRTDKALLEDKIGATYALRGDFEHAKESFLSAYSDASGTEDLVLQADTLIGLSSIAGSYQRMDEALDLATRALEFARRSKNLWIQSRCLGELGRLQLNLGKTSDARVSVEEALHIDHLNKYRWESEHLLYLAWITFVENRDVDQAIQLATSARALAIKQNDYIVFMQSSISLAHGYAQEGRLDQAISLIERSRDGLTEDGKPLFKDSISYAAATSLPLIKVSFLEALAFDYQAGKRLDDALKEWQDLYEVAQLASFPLATAEAAYGTAIIYQEKKEAPSAITWFALAADAYEKAGNIDREADALNSESVLMTQNAQGDKALQVDDALLSLAKARKDLRQEFIVDLEIAELSQPKGDEERTTEVLQDAESLLSPDLTLDAVGANLVAELYARLADFYGKKNDEVKQLIALEKAMTPFEAVHKPDLMLNLDSTIKTRLDNLRPLDKADQAEKGGDLVTALVYCELLQHFEQTDAKWRGVDYHTSQDDPVIAKQSEIIGKLYNQPGGIQALERNLEQLGPVVQAGRLAILGELTNYYSQHNQPEEVIKFATAAWPDLRLTDADHPQSFDVQISCDLALALLLSKDIPSAVQRVQGCLSSAKALGDPKLLIAAHGINLWVLGAAGRSGDAAESSEYLVQHTSQDPQYYLSLATTKSMQGNWTDSLDALHKALVLLEGEKNYSELAATHLRLAGLLSTGKVTDAEGDYGHLEKALELYKQLGDVNSQVTVGIALGGYFTRQKESMRARECFDVAMKLSQQEKNADLEASVLSASGESFRSFGDAAKALDSFRSAAKIYQDKDEPSKEASALRNEAYIVGFDMHRLDEALQLALTARQLSDLSGEWLERYWVHRLIADLDFNKGDYQGGLASLRGARELSASANQPLDSAWVDLQISGGLMTLGEWQGALDAVNAALPVLQQFDDTEDEITAYSDLTTLYGERESEIKDLDKALEYSRSAIGLLASNDSVRAGFLAEDVEEIYWQQGRYKEAIAKAQEALSHYEETKNIAGEADALISLAEAERSDGDSHSATTSLAKAEPMVKQTGDFYLTGRFYYGQANLYKQEGRLQDAIAQYERVISFLEEYKADSGISAGRSVAETYNYIYGELIDTYYLLGVKEDASRTSSAEKALEYAELNKSRTLINAWGHSFEDALRLKVPADLQERERDILARQASLHSELSQLTPAVEGRTVKQIQADLQQVAAEESLLEEKLRQSSPAYAEIRYPRPVAISDLPLRPGEVLIEFKMFDPALFVWILEGSPSGTHLAAFYKVSHTRQWFEERILDIRGAFNRDDPGGFNPKLSEELFEALFPENYRHTLFSADSVIFIPDDILFLLPLEILSPEASQNKYELLEVPTSYFPSAAALRLSRAITPAKREWAAQFLGIGDPVTSKEDERYSVTRIALDLNPIQKAPGTADVSPSKPGTMPTHSFTTRGYYFDRLPQTAAEVTNIAGLFPGGNASSTVRLGMDATKADLLQTDLGRFRFVHFATHGFLPVESSVGEPALILSYDGQDESQMMFKMSDILGLNLHSEMVVLSACNTGSGKVTRAEGVASLGTAFLAAGASSVTVSLWEVADKSTAILMQDYYRNLLAGMPKPKALATARASLVAQGYSNPFYWAPFVLTGE
jgi:CHAT domain-containing protein/tetratricopeptide (TPR) repeat protein